MDQKTQTRNPKPPAVLVVEDDARVARLIARSLTETGYETSIAGDGVQAWEMARSVLPDAIVLDVLLPRMDGIELCRRLRGDQMRIPILMLTARDTVPDRVRGLDAGADDYLTKPFALEELLARLRALLRRGSSANGDETLRVGDLLINLAAHEASRAGTPIDLTAKEFRLLAYLAAHPGRVLTRRQIMDHVWGYDSDATSNVVEIYVHYLRDKVDRAQAHPLIRTVRGAGYMMKE